MKLKIYILCLTIFAFYCRSASCEVKLPKLISDGMVLQQNIKIKIWGWAEINEKVTVKFNNKIYSTSADSNSKWSVILSPTKAGGPFSMEITASNQIILNDILVGDVWVCSGQSNMELTMERVKDKYPTIIANAENKNIRQFLVPDQYDFKKEHNDFENGSWVSVNPKTIFSFSAVAYFFAKDIYEKYRVPIGLINAALGGSPAEAWMSEDALIPFPDLYHEMQRFKHDDLIQEIETTDRNASKKWHLELNQKDKSFSSPVKWIDSKLNDDDWQELTIPGYWSSSSSENLNGSFWFRKKIKVPGSMTGKNARLWLGRIVDQDSVFVNGTFVGTTGYQYPPRKYELGRDILKEGENVIAMRVINSSGRGGFVLDKPYFLASDSDTIDLKGVWKFKTGATMPPLQASTAIRWKPGGLYNKMISPLINYPIKGVIWYQGEANTSRAAQYKKLFPALISNWRAKWGLGEFPFLFVQLANFMDTRLQPVESEWAQLREAQLQTLKKTTHTAMVVTIDLGEWNDIHPLNKEDVGKRLALAAEKLAYGNKTVVYSGPIFKSYRTKGNKIIITFSHTGKGLMAKNGALKYFAIAGADKKFVWAKANIEGNKVIVWGDTIDRPVVVRYAWADNPEGANLYNQEGLPASPFTTEN